MTDEPERLHEKTPIKMTPELEKFLTTKHGDDFTVGEYQETVNRLMAEAGNEGMNVDIKLPDDTSAPPEMTFGQLRRLTN